MQKSQPEKPTVKEEKVCPMIDMQVCILDARGIPQKCCLRGFIKFPKFLLVEKGHKINWRIPEINPSPKAVVTDIGASHVTIVFPFTEDSDARETGTGKILTFDDLIDLFLRYEPSLHITERGTT